MRAAKTTKEMASEELARLIKPEARETAAFDPTELRGLVEQSMADDDLALPIEPVRASNRSLLQAPMNDFDEPPSMPPVRMPLGSTGQSQLVTAPAAKAPASLLPWIIGMLIAAAGIAGAMWLA